MADHAAAMSFKNNGNGFFKKKNWQAAIDAYTQGIAVDANWEVLYSNRSQVRPTLLDCASGGRSFGGVRRAPGTAMGHRPQEVATPSGALFANRLSST